jgi:hypothetical protein
MQSPLFQKLSNKNLQKRTKIKIIQFLGHSLIIGGNTMHTTGRMQFSDLDQ